MNATGQWPAILIFKKSVPADIQGGKGFSLLTT